MNEYMYDAELIGVVDGTTVTLRLSRTFSFEVDFGFRMREIIAVDRAAEITLRLAGINSNPVNADAESLTTAALKALLARGPLRAKTYPPDIRGRWLVDLYAMRDEDGVTRMFKVNDELVRLGLTKEYKP